MIERLQTIATFLSRFRLLIPALGLIFVGLFLLSLFEASLVQGYNLLIPSIVGICWALTAYCCSVLFISVPPQDDPQAGFLVRWRARIRRGIAWSLALLMLALSLAVLVLTYQLLRAWFMG